MYWDTNRAKRCRHSDTHAAPPRGLSCVLGEGGHEHRHRASPVRPAAGRPGHGGAGAPAGPRPPRGAPRHAARVPPLRHGGALRHRGAHRGGRRRGRARGGRRLPRRALRHLQGLVRRRPPRQGAPGPPPDAQQPPDGVRGPVHGPLAGDHEGRAVHGPLHARGLRAVRHARRVGGHGGVPPPGPRQGHRRLQLLLQEARGPALLRHHPARSQPGGDQPGVAAEEAEGVLQGEGHPAVRLLAAGRQGHPLGQRLGDGLRRPARDRPVQGQDRRPGVPAVGVRAGRLPDREELRRGADEGEPGHRGVGADRGGEAADQQDPPAEDQPGPPLHHRARAVQVPRGALGRRDIAAAPHMPACLADRPSAKEMLRQIK